MRYLVRFSVCREGQLHDPKLFRTDSLETALVWAAMPGISVFDTQHNYEHVIAL